MASEREPSEHPTMIIPKGTEIRVNAAGELSIKTPGNLVIQNSGHYSEIESSGGSIRIEENVNVDAVTVKAADACYVLGSLTAWRVEARKLTLDDSAKAFVMLQESKELEVSKSARLVGNFGSEKEIFLMLSRYPMQMKALPLQVAPPMTNERTVLPRPAASSALPPEESDKLAFARILLERDVRRPNYDAGSRAALERILDAVRSGSLDRLRSSVDDDFSAVLEPSEDARRARDLIISRLRG